MSLDNFQLPAFLTAELYNDSLVVLDTNELTNKSLNENSLVFLGNNKKNILIIVNDENTVYLPDDSLTFLMDILTACKLTLSDTALINFNKNPGINYKSLVQHFQPEFVICLGIELSALAFPLEFPYYQVQQYNNQSYLSAPSLKILAADKQEKLQLWGCLKKLFSI
ncbi:MAG: hypothetical protein H7258_04390 [Ferruginibacter sp.]|nr:hypothetical protein [Ferruginibacter sp.]